MGSNWEKEEIPVTLKKDGSKEINFDNKVQLKFVLKTLFNIDLVRPNSPAQLAGLMKGDKITAINGKKANFYSIEDLTNLMKSEDGKMIVMKVERNGENKDFRFFLKDPLPFEVR